MDGTCSMHGVDEKIYRRIIVRWSLKKLGCESRGWVHLDQDRVQWQDLVNTVL
jgi:hypothetical protein